VRQKLAKVIADRDGGLVFDVGSLTVGEYLDRWLPDCVKGTVRETTFERYEYAIRPHIKPVLGRVKLKSLTPAHVRAFYREKLDAGLAPATVHKMHVVLHKALDQAVADGLIPRNATDAVKSPRIDSEEINPLTADEANRFIEAACGERLEALYVLAIHTGLRQGELLGLKWEDLDLTGARSGSSAPSLMRVGNTHCPNPKRRRAAAPCVSHPAPWPLSEITSSGSWGRWNVWALSISPVGSCSRRRRRDHQPVQSPQPLFRPTLEACWAIRAGRALP
jgi:hypothetical protein